MPRKRKCRQQPDERPTRDAAEPTSQPATESGMAKARTGEPVEYTELVLLVHAGNMPEAELFKAELEAHGIPTILEGEGAGVAGIPDVGAGVPVLVPEELADEAAELIAELESTRPEGDDLDDEETLDNREDDLEDIEDDDLEELDSLDDDLDDEDDDLDDDDWDDDDDDDWDDDEEWEDDDE